MIDSKKRDLINLFLIKKKLEKINYKVFFCRNGMELPYIVRHEIDIVVLTQLLSLEWIKLAYKIRKLGCLVVSLHSEGHPLKQKKKIFLAKGPVNNYECLDAVFAWTKQQKIYFDKFNKNLKTYWVGYPRLISMQKKNDYFRTNLSKFTLDKNFLKIKKKFKVKILVATNFVRADYHDYKSEKKFIHEKKGIVNSKIASDSRKKFIKFFNEITKNREIMFILKIHPMEKADLYLKNIIQRENVFISINDYIEAILPETDYLMARSCHTQYEAFALNKKAIELSLFSKDDYKNRENKENLYSIKDINDFNSLKKKIFKKNLKKNSKFIHRVNNEFLFFNGKSQAESKIINGFIEISAKVRIKNINFFDKIYYSLKYYLLTIFDYKFHDMFFQKNKLKNINGNNYYIDYRNRIDKHFHNNDIIILENAFKKKY